jgi:hypothetical protein
MKMIHSVLIALIGTLVATGIQASEKSRFNYWRCNSKEISDEEADLILAVEVIDIQRIMDPILHHSDFGVAARIIERRKGDYEDPVIGIHVPRQIPLEDYDPKEYGFEKGMKTTIKAKIDDKGAITIHDERIKPR